MGWHSALDTEEIGCSFHKWQWHKSLGASASQESSRTFKTPAASSPTIVNTEAVCCDWSCPAAKTRCGSRWARQLGEAGEERWKREEPSVWHRAWGQEAAATQLYQSGKVSSRTSVWPRHRRLQRLHLGPCENGTEPFLYSTRKKVRAPHATIQLLILFPP